MRPFYFLAFLLFISSCKKSEKQLATVEFTFNTVVGDAAFSFSEYFTNGDGKKIRLEVLQFYLADIMFVTDKGKEVKSKDIALIRCENGTGNLVLKVPAGEYKSVKFGIGVPAEMNEAGPAEFTETDHPLNATQNTYWGMNSMYRFVMIDGKYDLTGDGTDDGGFSYHTGFNDCYREVELAHEFSFEKKGSYAENLIIDVTELFYVAGSMIDVSAESNFHGNYDEIDLANRLSDNFAAAIRFQ